MKKQVSLVVIVLLAIVIVLAFAEASSYQVTFFSDQPHLKIIDINQRVARHKIYIIEDSLENRYMVIIGTGICKIEEIDN